ncbi:MAG TPA: hypothetical protein VKZ49_06085 [Polyangiaceae bacterium]|nr:hypothetical protein [Polyangiaceae bacterium]
MRRSFRVVVAAWLVGAAASGCEREAPPDPVVPAPPGLASGAHAARGAMAADIGSDGGGLEPEEAPEDHGEVEQPKAPGPPAPAGASQGLPL